MLFLGLAFSIIIIFLGYKLFYAERQISSLIKQLSVINKNKSGGKITIGLSNKKIELLAEEINETIVIRKQSEAERMKVENDLKQTIANMSHDLRTPLTSIIGYLQFLKLDELSENEKKEYLEIAEHRAKSLEKLLNDFYELSLIESLDYEINMEKLNINKILQEIILGRYADFAERDITPNIEITSNTLYVMAEKKSLERIIENLLSNAIKYGKDKIDICLKEEKGGMLLTFSNTFTSLTEEDMENIFDRFYMADKTRSGRGTGLGLAIVKGLVEKMNGTISSDIKGDMFNIYCSFQIIN
ncbi:HAMP domain-containing histidine kinase [Clostridium sp. YIM B02505]|uniref:histidine kinase n=1 Tax=Clostridium yunnanense TaxID=2800325 RepID=A0ABS1EV97_9CLOT|nr:HAMP domain-containing sensor histidine kinase [Clostridium yunnanense]MBK1813316.1 HAMP domain-containing histidine kinase [Clostridium yunnanense]